MKVEVILDAMQEDKVVIHATSLTPEVQKIYSYLKSLESAQATIIGYHEDLEYYHSFVNSILQDYLLQNYQQSFEYVLYLLLMEYE